MTNLALFSNQLVLGKPVIAMCSVCHKIRNLMGNWHQLEIDDTVEISHSLCKKHADEELEKIDAFFEAMSEKLRGK